MDNLDIKNLQLSYLAVYDENLCESMEELGLIAEARDGYGDDSKFNKPDDKIEKPGTTVPKPKKGGYGRISRSTPYGIGAHANRTASRVTTIVGEDPGAPRAEKMAKETSKKSSGKKMVKKDGKWVKEAQDYYDIILSHLLDEGYANTVEEAEAIMEVVIGEGRKPLPVSKMSKQARKKSFRAGQELDKPIVDKYEKASKDLLQSVRMGRAGGKDVMKHVGKGFEQGRRYATRREQVDIYDIILSHLLDEGYAETVEEAETIMVNMSEEWVDSIING